MIQVSLWNTLLSSDHARCKVSRKNPDPEVISVQLGHDLTIYVDEQYAARLVQALTAALTGPVGMDWSG